uniref:Putative orcoquinin n=1 Tax=Rhodnius prolixus TaxID=13249 RepID=R4FK46_RHOPR
MEDKEGRNLDTLGSGNLLRDLEAVLRAHPNLFYGRPARNHDTLDSLSGITFGSQKRFDPLSSAYAADKRNFDEIDRSGFNSFIKKKKNFDEIDRSGFDGFVKRNFDEIDRVGFGSFIKKSEPHH